MIDFLDNMGGTEQNGGGGGGRCEVAVAFVYCRTGDFGI